MSKLVLFILGVSIGAQAGVTQQQLDQIAQKIVMSNNLPYGGQVVVDPMGSGGVAAIRYQGRMAQISAHPQMMQRKSVNTWAFIIGHELSHQVLGHTGQNGAQHERDADEKGAKLALKAGYNLKSYIRDMYNEPNSCSRSHGCYHARAKNLESEFNIDTGEWSEDHANHRAGSGPYPPATVQTPWATFPQARRVPCRHTMPCQHPVMTQYGWKPMHQFDVMHPFDILQ